MLPTYIYSGSEEDDDTSRSDSASVTSAQLGGLAAVGGGFSPARDDRGLGLGLGDDLFGTFPIPAGTCSEEAISVSVAALEKDVAFMAFFYAHLAVCPPHGPFKFYSAITLVERAGRIFATEEGGSTSSSQDCSARLQHVSVASVLALMEVHYNTAHLGNCPLLYVPAEVHSDDVRRVEEEQSSIPQSVQ